MNEPAPLEASHLSAAAMTRRAFLATGAASAAVPLLLRGSLADAASAAVADFGFPPADETGRYTKNIAFPVAGHVSWTDTYGACRDGCRRHHEGQDLFGKKGQKLIATVNGTIVVLRHRSTGNSIYIKSDADGWFYGYLHINNDRPGTDDNYNAYSQAFAPHIALGSHVRRGQHIAYLGDSGNAETTSPHCHFEIRKPASSVWHSQSVNAKYSLIAAQKHASSSGRATVPAPSSVPVMRLGDRSAKVAALQRALNAGTGSRLVRDGDFGPATEVAMRDLQRWCGIAVDGVYGRHSQFALHIACENYARRH